MNKTLKFSVEEIKRFDASGYDESEYAVGRMKYLSTRANSHGLHFSDEVFQRDANTILGKWVVAGYNGFDFGSHDPNEYIMGIVPKEQDVEFVETDEGYIDAYVDVVLSKRYAKEGVDVFAKDNNRAVSIEFNYTHPEDDENEIESFIIRGVTMLGHNINPSVPTANIAITRFSEDEANAFFNKVHNTNLTELQKFVANRRESVAEKKTYKIDKSKEAVSTKPWGSVDKIALRDKIMEAANRDALVKATYMLIEAGWEDAPSEHLKYPVMELKGDTFVYNKGGLSSALGYAKKENETTVVNKINKIYKNLGLEQDGKEEDEMSEVNFEDKVEVVEEMAETKEEEMDCKKMEETPEEVESEKDKEVEDDDKDDDDDEDEMSADEMKAEMARMKSEIEERDNIIMEKDTELDELRKFKEGIESKELASAVENVMADVKDCLSAEQIKAFREEGLKCKMAEFDGWSNKVKAASFEASKGRKTKKSDVFSFSATVETNVDPKNMNVWDRLRNKF